MVKMKVHKIFVLILTFLTLLCSGYEFKGVHYTASLRKCESSSLRSVQSIIQELRKAIEASGATILSYDSYLFSGDGLTATFLLSESHASIHTYPEHDACFVDLFTCGSHCHWEPFHDILIAYLKPQEFEFSVHTRE